MRLLDVEVSIEKAISKCFIRMDFSKVLENRHVKDLLLEEYFYTYENTVEEVAEAIEREAEYIVNRVKEVIASFDRDFYEWSENTVKWKAEEFYFFDSWEEDIRYWIEGYKDEIKAVL